ncbi:MAG: hypothetical protein WDN04_03510 [Rhodospirillales bacterium]
MLHRVAVGKFKRQRIGLAPGLAYFLCGAIERRLVARRQHDRGACIGKAAGHRAAQAARCAGDQRHTSL